MDDTRKTRYGLSLDTIKKINTIFNRFEEVDTVILYGSRAKGNHKPGSDIDLTVKGKHVSLTVLNRISNMLDDLLLPYMFDLSIYHHIGDQGLLEHIKRVGIVFFCRREV